MRYQIIHSDLLEPDPLQPRQSMDDGGLQELKENVRVHGVLQPLIVFENGKRHTIVDGHRRFEVCYLLDIKEIPVLILPARPDAETLLLMQLAANGMHENLKPSEKALAYRRLKEMRGLSNADLASLMNVSKSVVTETLSYLDLPPEALALLDAGQIGGSTAYAVSRAPDEATRQELIAKAVRGELRRDDALRRVNRRRAAETKREMVNFRLASGDLRIALETEPAIPVVVQLLQEMMRECRRAEKQGLNVKTLERVLMDRSQQGLGGEESRSHVETISVEPGGER
ncbi:MAG: ParB/RepB/Spo0J family partition protein [Planctomyces sp.]